MPHNGAGPRCLVGEIGKKDGRRAVGTRRPSSGAVAVASLGHARLARHPGPLSRIQDWATLDDLERRHFHRLSRAALQPDRCVSNCEGNGYRTSECLSRITGVEVSPDFGR